MTHIQPRAPMRCFFATAAGETGSGMVRNDSFTFFFSALKVVILCSLSCSLD